MKLCILPMSLGLTLLIGLGTTAWAQDKTNFTSLQTTLKQKDDVTVTTVGGDKIKGQMLDVSADRITVQLRGGPQTFEAAQIQKVQKRKNGILLGGLIGLGASIPFVITLSTYQYNEGGDRSAAFLPMPIGIVAGLGIDAAIGSNKTLYERKPSRTVTVAPLMDRNGGMGARLAFNFQEEGFSGSAGFLTQLLGELSYSTDAGGIVRIVNVVRGNVGQPRDCADWKLDNAD